MVKHIVLWNFNPEMPAEEKKAAGAKMKELLEPIKELVDGAVEIRVITDGLESSNREIALRKRGGSESVSGTSRSRGGRKIRPKRHL